MIGGSNGMHISLQYEIYPAKSGSIKLKYLVLKSTDCCLSFFLKFVFPAVIILSTIIIQIMVFSSWVSKENNSVAFPSIVTYAKPTLVVKKRVYPCHCPCVTYPLTFTIFKTLSIPLMINTLSRQTTAPMVY